MRKKAKTKKYRRRKPSARRRRRAPKYRRIECQLGQIALRYARAKGFLSRIEKGMAKAENPDPFKRQKIAKKIADIIRAAAKEDLAGRPVSSEELKRRIRAAQGRNPGGQADKIADFIMSHQAAPIDLMRRYGLSLAKADKITRHIKAHAFGPGGRGFRWAVKEIEKIRRRK